VESEKRRGKKGGGGGRNCQTSEKKKGAGKMVKKAHPRARISEEHRKMYRWVLTTPGKEKVQRKDKKEKKKVLR